MTIAATNAASVGANPQGGMFGTTKADFNMFLKLLTTQMQNQDPLDPMDTSEYTQQLVQYSQVEQSIAQTGVLRDILQRLSMQDMAQASSFIGQEVEFDSTVAGLSGEPAQWAYDLPRNASSLTAVITDASGRQVDTRTLDAADRSGRFVWDGKLASGGTAPAGSYSLTLSAKDSSGTAIPVSPRALGTVRELTSLNGALMLGVNGVQLPAASIVRVRQAG